ncbi:MAG: cytochrome c biogenesis protein CcsA [Chloroflexi bacterium]|nr:cytochrome c biogenesis protein CcsA [Chloroflexota bacterium]
MTTGIKRTITQEKVVLSSYTNLFLLGVLVLMVFNLYLIFVWVPTDQNLGNVQRVFYFHVPIAWVGFLAFFIVFIASVVYLIRGSEKWDALAYSAAEIGVLFTSLMLLTGILWAKPVWGVWWTWDARLTTTLILWFIYVAYLMLRAYAPRGSQGARYSAILGIIGFIDVPIVYFAVNWWRTLHPEYVVGPAAESGSLETSMLVALLISVVTFTALFSYLLTQRYSLRWAETLIERLHYNRV